MQIERSTDAVSFNAIVNHPEVYPDLADVPGPIDVSPQLQNEQNYLLRGEHGGCLFVRVMPALFEVHTAILPSGRGAWALSFINTALSWMFINTDAWDIATRVPDGHIAAKAATIRSGARHEFTTSPGALWRGKMTPMHTYSLRVQDWIGRADGLMETGEWLHRRMGEEAKRLGITTPPHEHDDDAHYRYVGACYLMTKAGQIIKGVSLYNRWAILARHRPIYMIGEVDAVRMDIGVLRLKGDDIEITPCA